MDLDEILRVDRCRDMDELIDFWARSGSYSPDAKTGFLSQISYTLRNFVALPSLAYFSANVAYFSAISICAKLARSILIFFSYSNDGPQLWNFAQFSKNAF